MTQIPSNKKIVRKMIEPYDYIRQGKVVIVKKPFRRRYYKNYAQRKSVRRVQQQQPRPKKPQQKEKSIVIGIKTQIPTINSNISDIKEFIDKHNAKSGNPFYMYNYPINKIPNQTYYNKLTKKQQQIIWNELSEESMFITGDEQDTKFAKEYYPHLKYSFINMEPSKLPASSWEDLNQEIEIFGKEEAIKKINNILKLEDKIKKEGYNKDHPITIEYIPEHKKIGQSMGNHRLQAVRNLMARNELPNNFKIPTMFIINNPTIHKSVSNNLRKERIKERL